MLKPDFQKKGQEEVKRKGRNEKKRKKKNNKKERVRKRAHVAIGIYPRNDDRSRLWNRSMGLVTSYFNSQSLHMITVQLQIKLTNKADKLFDGFIWDEQLVTKPYRVRRRKRCYHL